MIGERRGITIVPNRFQKLAPSIAAASIIDFGMACNPAKKIKSYNLFFPMMKLKLLETLLDHLLKYDSIHTLKL